MLGYAEFLMERKKLFLKQKSNKKQTNVAGPNQTLSRWYIGSVDFSGEMASENWK